jgi:hypothetical protein
MMATTFFMNNLNGILMKKKLRQCLLPVVALLMALVLCSCGKQAEQENQLLRVENQSLKAENQRLQGEIEGFTAALNSTPKTDKATVTPLDIQPVQSSTAIQPPTTNPNAPQQKYWLTTSSNKRHNSSCRYFENSRGRYCGTNEGIPCKLCGG